MGVEPADGEVGELLRGGAGGARRVAIEWVPMQSRQAVVVVVEALVEPPRALEVVVGQKRGGGIAVLLEHLRKQPIRGHHRGRPVLRGRAPCDGRFVAAGEDRRHRVARRRRMRPAVLKQRRFPRESVDARAGGAGVAVGAEVVGAHRVDGDEEHVRTARHRRWERGEGGPCAGLRRRLMAVAILIDPVVGPVERARVDLGVEVVAVGAEQRRVAIAVEVAHGVDAVDERAGQPAVRDRRLAHALGFAEAETAPDQQRRDDHRGGDPRSIPSPIEPRPHAHQRRRGRAKERRGTGDEGLPGQQLRRRPRQSETERDRERHQQRRQHQRHRR